MMATLKKILGIMPAPEQFPFNADRARQISCENDPGLPDLLNGTIMPRILEAAKRGETKTQFAPGIVNELKPRLNEMGYQVSTNGVGGHYVSWS